ncbi:MAG: tetratricopeptide repeat protein [Cyanobacteria bacterium P01_E01_bin.6]
MRCRFWPIAVAIATTVVATTPVIIGSEIASAQQRISQADDAPSGEGFTEAFDLIQQGLVYIGNGEPEAAITAFEDSLAISRTIGDRELESIALIARGKALVDVGETDSARTSVQDGLAIAEDLGDVQLVSLAEGVLAELE